MDILVTTPKSEIDNAKVEGDLVKAGGGFFFRTFHFRPKVELQDKIYFVENGEITGYGIIIGIENLTEATKCDATGRSWGNAGDWIIKYNDWHWLKEKIKMTGFQGLRYVDRFVGLRDKLNETEKDNS